MIQLLLLNILGGILSTIALARAYLFLEEDQIRGLPFPQRIGQTAPMNPEVILDLRTDEHFLNSRNSQIARRCQFQLRRLVRNDFGDEFVLPFGSPRLRVEQFQLPTLRLFHLERSFVLQRIERILDELCFVPILVDQHRRNQRLIDRHVPPQLRAIDDGNSACILYHASLPFRIRW